ncbi:glycerophosphodiester phosphodiesterase family protein [Bifidobacterium sp.]|uniref:glycerophosphodiester phosphodiesterase family protein n=1 Tax=Bifidobacterium sp. TaxID=41200 RepID=UPI0025BA4622|nr:glycerophosphodiester phosphodiesterase family protein [Bifidobacterium sp.]MCH4209355.1 hypothetical protein [Bifidobacterium sp.]MCI1224149.1 hypothetical protein [Bifidobacterium sp.]
MTVASNVKTASDACNATDMNVLSETGLSDTSSTPAATPAKRTQILGYAGATHAAPPNTMEAFQAALDEGADGTELDVQRTSDGRLVCIHDAQLGRLSDGHGLVGEHTYEELRRLDFSKTRPGLAAARIALLGDALELMREHNKFVNIEVKSTDVIYPGIEAQILRLVTDLHMNEQVCYSTFNHFSLLEFTRLDSAAQIAPLYNEGLVDPWAYAKHIGASAAHPYYRNLTEGPGVLNGFLRSGVTVRAWTVDEPDSIRWLVAHHVDAIITDVPGVARHIRDDGEA